MSSATSTIQTLSTPRLRAFAWPREHGAWAMLAVALLTGAGAGLSAPIYRGPGLENLLSVALFATAAVALFCLRTPLEAWLGVSALRPQSSQERRIIFASLGAYAGIAAAALAVLFWRAHAYGLLILGTAAAWAFVAQSFLRKLHSSASAHGLSQTTRLHAQLLGAAALTSAAAGACYLAAGKWDRAIILWAANWVFAANQIHYVQVRIHGGRARSAAEKFLREQGFLWGEFLTLAWLGICWGAGWLPGLALLAFAPVLVRGFAWVLSPPRPLEVHRLGVSELLHSLAFGALLIGSYRVHGV